MPTSYRPKIALDSPQGATTESLGRDVERLAAALQEIEGQVVTAQKVIIPARGRWSLYIMAEGSSAGSTGVNYHLIRITRNGVNLPATLDTRSAEIAGYTLLSMGTETLNIGDLLSPAVTIVGTPSPTFLASNFTLLCVRSA